MIINETQSKTIFSISLDRKLYESLLWYWLPLLAYAGVIAYLSSLPNPVAHFQHITNSFASLPVDTLTRINDKIFHITEYAILGILTYRAIQFTWGPRIGTAASAITVVSVMLFGCTDEFHQWFTPLRHVEGWDIMADAFGGLIGVSLWKWANNIPTLTFLD